MMEFVERKRWLFFGLPFTFTKYTVKEDLITIDSGYATRINTLENHQTVYEPKVNNHLSDSSAHIEEEERRTWNATAKKKLVVENGVLFFK